MLQTRWRTPYSSVTEMSGLSSTPGLRMYFFEEQVNFTSGVAIEHE